MEITKESLKNYIEAYKTEMKKQEKFSEALQEFAGDKDFTGFFKRDFIKSYLDLMYSSVDPEAKPILEYYIEEIVDDYEIFQLSKKKGDILIAFKGEKEGYKFSLYDYNQVFEAMRLAEFGYAYDYEYVDKRL